MTKAPQISASERKWRAQDALRTLTEAERIRSDKTLMADVKRQAKEQVASLAKVAGGTAAARRPATRKPAGTRKK